MEEYIRIRAYELFERGGRAHGHDIEDWLQAESEILGKKGASAEDSRRRSKTAKAG